jgi:hypothetical protein
MALMLLPRQAVKCVFRSFDQLRASLPFPAPRASFPVTSIRGNFGPLSEEDGSLSILILALFFITLISSLGVVDVSDNFLAKRQLIEVGEVAISRAAHQISLTRYYTGNILMDNSGADGAQFRIPIDCSKAFASFSQEISISELRNQPITIEQWNCTDDEVSGTISAQIPILLKLPFGIGLDHVTVTSTVGATSIIGGVRP